MSWMVFRAPGLEKIHGHAVEYKVIDEAQREEHLAAGWFDTAVAAGEAYAQAKAEAAARELEDVEEKAIATRDEAIQKLEELGATFDRRWGVSRLCKAVEEALAAKKEPAPPVDGAQG